MTTAHDLYGAYTDAELVELWNGDSVTDHRSALLEEELRTRGYAPLYPDGQHRATLTVHSGSVTPTDETPAAEQKRYRVALSTTPDEDGHFAAEITQAADDEYVTTIFDKDRERLRERVADRIAFLKLPKGPDEVYEL